MSDCHTNGSVHGHEISAALLSPLPPLYAFAVPVVNEHGARVSGEQKTDMFFMAKSIRVR